MVYFVFGEMEMNTDKLHIYGAFLLTGIILGSFIDFLDKHPQEPALSRYCIDYCMKEYLKISSGEVDFYEVKRHCSEFFKATIP